MRYKDPNFFQFFSEITIINKQIILLNDRDAKYIFAQKDCIPFILTQSSLSTIILFNIQSFQIEKKHSGQTMQRLNFNLAS